jgi:hypothetical protein
MATLSGNQYCIPKRHSHHHAAGRRYQGNSSAPASFVNRVVLSSQAKERE